MGENMTEPFVILHLSDAHIGNPKHKSNSLSVFDGLIADLEKTLKDQKLRPDLIIFSGDLAFGELEDKPLRAQYDDVKEFVNKILDIFDNKPRFFVCPGNHDNNREVVDNAHREMRNRYSVDTVYEMQRDNKYGEFSTVLRRQQEWVEFANSVMPPDFDIDNSLNMVKGFVMHGGKKVAIVGLNTAWSSFGDGEQGKLWVGRYQVERALMTLDGADFKIVVAHHPMDWMHESEKNFLCQRLEQNFDIFFHGHEHSGWFIDSKKHLTIKGGACYDRTDRENAFSWTKIDFQSKRCELFWRRYEDKGSAWIAANWPGKTDEMGYALIENLFPREEPTPAHKLTDLTISNNPAHPSRRDSSARDLPIARDLDSFLNMLDDSFGFTWQRPSAAQKPYVVFWPVRLRKPTPIHAVQSFVAAGLTKFGCEIYLWLDDLGAPEIGESEFSARIASWFQKVGVNASFKKRLFSEFLPNQAELGKSFLSWKLVQKWLGDNETHQIEKILQIAKVFDGEETDRSLALRSKRPRKLLTPSLTWTCLAEMLDNDNFNDKTIITLGGHDEQILWNAWHECVKDSNSEPGHLYTPTLRRTSGVNLHMEKTNIAWRSREEIRKAIESEMEDSSWHDEERLIPWCFNLCSILPRSIANENEKDGYPTINDRKIYSLDDLRTIEGNLSRSFAGELKYWLIPN